MKITTNYSYRPVSKENFKAKFFHTDDLKEIVEYAKEKGKLEQLLEGKSNIDKGYLRTRLRVYTGENENGIPFIKFVRMVPKNHVVVPQCVEDYKIEKVITYEAPKKAQKLRFALYKLMKLFNNAPENKVYQEVVAKK